MKLFLTVITVVVLAIGTLTWVFQNGLKRFDEDVSLQSDKPRGAFFSGDEVAPEHDRFQRAASAQVAPFKLPKEIVAEPKLMLDLALVEELEPMAPIAFVPAVDATEELTTDLPEAMFEGTKKPFEIPNLEPVEKRQSPLVVPPGVRLLSLEKRVSASDALPVIGDLEYVTDGDKDAQDGSYVELGPQVQWVQIDLEMPQEIHAVWVWHFHKSARVYNDVIVQVSNDPNFASDQVFTIYNADHDNSTGLGNGGNKAYVETNRGRVMPAGGAVARYVRLYSNGNSANEMNHYVEVEVWGRSESSL